MFKYPKFHDCGKFKYDSLLKELFGDERGSDGNKEEYTTGMDPQCEEANKRVTTGEWPYLKFDAQFESGNLDMVVKVIVPNMIDARLGMASTICSFALTQTRSATMSGSTSGSAIGARGPGCA